MATTNEEKDRRTPLESFLSGDGINLDDLGAPPLANREDPLLDRDRLDLNIDLEADE